MNERGLEFVETPIFTKQIDTLLSDEEYRQMQNELIRNPERGKLIPHSQSLRKLRWPVGGHGKRGGMRVIYFYRISADHIHLMFAYRKNRQSDITAEQARTLNAIVKEIENEG